LKTSGNDYGFKVVYKLCHIKKNWTRNLRNSRKKDKEMLRLIERKVRDILEDPYRF